MTESSRGSGLSVITDAARDLLQSAEFFSNEKLVAWEYISNSLQYVDPGTSPKVDVVVDSRQKRMIIADNGRGMDLAGLRNFFVMHGENVDRRTGKPGRGRFGTGKSAAFGIAEVLRVTTTRDGRRSKVELTKADIKRTRKGAGPVERVPVRIVESEVPSPDPNGTRVEIEGIKLRKLDPKAIVSFVERHLARWPNKDASVTVNTHVCEYAEPPTRFEREFTPNPSEADVIGDDVVLKVKVAKAPLDEEQRGVAIFGSGVWYETTLAGLDRKEFADYLFGEVDVPRIDEDQELSAFDASRRQRLNRENPIVSSLIAFIGRSLESVRAELTEEAKRQKASQTQKRLAREARQIEKIINDDFQDWRTKLSAVLAKPRSGTDAGSIVSGGGTGPDELIAGGLIPAVEIGETGGLGHADGNGNGHEPPTAGPSIAPDPAGESHGQPAGGTGKSRRPRGGFSVEFDHLGAAENRARYARERRTIYVNLDHPQVKAALGSRDTTDPVFRRLAYEVAFTEYAFALAVELDDEQWFSDTVDALFEIRDTVNRVAKLSANLYAE
jgi:histidine kinase/DNA gyrase B/HSP90-like ATPase